MILFTDSVNWNGEDRKRESKFEQFKCGVLNTSTAQPGHMGHAGTESSECWGSDLAHPVAW